MDFKNSTDKIDLNKKESIQLQFTTDELFLMERLLKEAYFARYSINRLKKPDNLEPLDKPVLGNGNCNDTEFPFVVNLLNRINQIIKSMK